MKLKYLDKLRLTKNREIQEWRSEWLKLGLDKVMSFEYFRNQRIKSLVDNKRK